MTLLMPKPEAPILSRRAEIVARLSRDPGYQFWARHAARPFDAESEGPSQPLRRSEPLLFRYIYLI